ncbi:LysR family transcriptional regulator [Sphingomicrobium nitratireducens]|uniref:LysR family transcriptional regulator n=1 Tax=Sphingomicrobium nitratireducens TaxID=2964666 RepID=UPI00223EAC8F|nr:LysR family transcriptional regulator [Sphingomicrobium nitratireducens]
MFDWNDLRYFLAVAEAGSTLKAARALGANQTTVARRVHALEASLGHALFEKQRSGYRLSEMGERLLDLARAVEQAANAVAAEAAASARSLSGTVRLTANEVYSAAAITPLLVRFKQTHPEIRIELDHSSAIRDLGKGEADIGFRVDDAIKGDALIARRICEDRWTFFCSAHYAADHGKPRSVRDIVNSHVVGGGAPGIREIYERWLETHAPGVEPVMTYDSTSGLLAAVRSGAGLAALPVFAVGDDPLLIQCFPSNPVKRHIWLVTHERVRAAPHVRAVMSYLGDELTKRARALGLP